MKANAAKSIKVVSTAHGTNDRLTVKGDLSFKEDKKGVETPLIVLYEDVKYQEIVGFGGAFTESGAYALDKMSRAKRDEIINAYFNPHTGIGYNFCRTHINSCDFSLKNYNYLEADGDVELKSFSVANDDEHLIPFIKDALKINGGIKLFASPWSPPGWMKTSGTMNNGGKLKEEYKQVWASYVAKYIKEYAGRGIKIWGITVQNEPKATQTWDSCVYTAEDERDYVRDHLGPTLQKEGLSDVKIMIWDHNKERLYERSSVAYADPEASKYIWGTGFHWYSGEHFEALSAFHDRFPDKNLVFTEGCEGPDTTVPGVKGWGNYSGKLGYWVAGEKYARDIIGDLNNWTVGFTDWNMVLDEKGGPVHDGNFCGAPIIADTASDTVLYKSSYYYIGHFSKYIKRGARRIAFSRFSDVLDVTAFENPDGQFVVVVMNRNDTEVKAILKCRYGIADIAAKPHSIMTLLY